jgi:mycothiol synthase
MTTETHSLSTTAIAGLHARPATTDDLAGICAAINAWAVKIVGRPTESAERLGAEWETSPNFNLETDTRVYLNAEGQIVAYAEVYDGIDMPVFVFAFARVHPDYQNKGIGWEINQWLELRSKQAIAKVPANARVALVSHIPSTDEDTKKILSDYGYVHTRNFWRMAIELPEAPPAPQVPEGFQLRSLKDGLSNEALYAAFDEGFSDHWGHTPIGIGVFNGWQKEPDFDPSLWWAIMDGDQIAGLCLCSPKLTEDPQMGWVGDLTVLRPWRKRGLAQFLLKHAFAELHSRGCARVGLGVDADSLTGATRLYEKVGMSVVRVSHRYEFELRAGETLTTTEVK